MAPTWREERPEAITAASHKAERPSRSMVTIFSALSSSSDARMRVNSSLCGALFGFSRFGAMATAFFFAPSLRGLWAGFLADFGAGLEVVFRAGDLAALLFLAGVLLRARI